MVKVAFVTPWSIDDERAWSGAIRPMHEALAGHLEVVPVSTKGVRDAFVDRGAARLLDGWRGRRYNVGHALSTALKRGISLRRILRQLKPDVVLAVAASQDIAFLTGPWPVVQVSDLTFDAAMAMYPDFQELHLISRVQGQLLARCSGRRTSHTLAATEWVRALLIGEGVETSRVTLAPFGPCITPVGDGGGRTAPSTPRILAVISNWHRKGGNRVLAIHEELQKRGFAHQLTIVGEVPERLPDSVTAAGRVSRDEMAKLYQSHHLLLEPARANASGITLTDAAAFGVPAIVAKSGGVETIVVDGVTGRVVPQGEGLLEAAVSAVSEIFAEWSRYSKAASQRSADLLNWKVWGERAAAAIRQVSGAN